MLAISHALCAALAIAVADVQHIQGGQGAPAVGADPTAAEKGLDFWRTSPPPPAAVDGGFNPLWFLAGEEASPPPPPPTLFTRFTNVFKREPEPEPEPEPESKAFYFFEKEEPAAREKALPVVAPLQPSAAQPASISLAGNTDPTDAEKGLDFWRSSPPPPAAVDGGFNPLWFIGGEEASPPPPPPTLFTRFTNVFKREPEPEPEPEPESKAFYFFEKEEPAAREKALPVPAPLQPSAAQPASISLAGNTDPTDAEKGLDFWRSSPPPPAAVDGGFNPLWFIGGEEASPPPPPPTLFTRFTNVFKREPEPEPEPEPESKAFYFFEKEELAAREKAIPFSHAAAAVQPAGLALQAEAGARSAVEPKLVAGRASLFHAGLGCVALGAVLLAGLARWRAKQPSQRQINLV